MDLVKKKILLLSTGDINGAYEAMYKITYFLRNQGHEAKLLVKAKTRHDSFIVKYINKKRLLDRFKVNLIDRLIKKLYFKENIKFDSSYYFISKDELSVNTNPQQIIDLIGFIPEYIFVGMTNDFMNSTDLLVLQQYTNAQVYTITVDMNHFTGGCHFAWDCKGYVNGCSQACPAILSKKNKNMAKINFENKLQNAKKGNFKIISGSGWTLKQAQESMIYKNQKYFPNINSFIDTTIMNARSRKYAKDIFSLEHDKFYILMGSQYINDSRKGFEYLLESLKILHKQLSEQEQNKIRVIIVSKVKNNHFDHIPFQKEFLDYITDYRLLSLLYQASDVFVNSSIEDSGPMMVSEALACGTPVVGFDMGVVNNMVVDGFNGYKAILKDSNDLAKGIKTIFELSKEEYNLYCQNGVNKVEAESSFNFAKSVFDTILNT